MLNWLLTAGTDNKPELEASLTDNIINTFEENGDELWLMFALGICAGITISYFYRTLKRLLISEMHKDDIDNSDDSSPKNDK